MLPSLARATPRPPKAPADRLLIFQPDHLGDILLSEPAVRFLRDALPDTELIAVVGPWSAEIVTMAWPVDRVVSVEYPGFTRRSGRRSLLSPYQLLHQEMRRLQDVEAADAVVLRDDAWWAAWLAYGSVGGQIVTGSDNRSASFATSTPETPPPIHRTAVAMQIAGNYLAVRGLSPSLTGWDMSPRLLAPLEARSSPDLEAAPPIVIHPGSGAPVKLWTVDAWRTLVRRLDNVNIVLTGSQGEVELCQAVASGFEHATVVAGKTSLLELTILLDNAVVAIGTDNGPMHLAGALGTPTVRLFGPSNPDRYGPWPGTPGQVVISAGWICPRCEDLSLERNMGCGCMAAITPDQVLVATRSLLSHGA